MNVFEQLLMSYEELLDKRQQLESNCNLLSKFIDDSIVEIRDLKNTIKEEFQKINMKMASKKAHDGSDGPGMQANAKSEDEIDEIKEWKLSNLTEDEETQLPLSLVCEIRDMSPVSKVKFSENEELLAFGGNATLRVYSFEQGKMVLDMKFNKKDDEDETNFVRSLEWCCGDELIIVGLEEGTIKVINVNNGEIKNELNEGNSEIFDIKTTKDKKLMGLTNGENVYVYECLNFEKILSYENKNEIALINSICFDDDGKKLAIGLSSGYILIWDIDNNKIVCQMKCHLHGIYSILFIKDSKELVTASLDNTIKIWEIEVNEDGVINLILHSTISDHKDFVLAMTTDSNYNWLISGSKDTTIKFYSLTENKTMLNLSAHTNSVLSLDYAKTKNIFCSGSGDNSLMIWKISTEKDKE